MIRMWISIFMMTIGIVGMVIAITMSWRKRHMSQALYIASVILLILACHLWRIHQILYDLGDFSFIVSDRSWFDGTIYVEEFPYEGLPIAYDIFFIVLIMLKAATDMFKGGDKNSSKA